MVQQINMKNIIVSSDEIPDSWIYKFYAEKYNRKINQPFDGRNIKIHSFINKDSTPSFCFYYNKTKKKYNWYDYSAGKGGDSIDFVSYLEKRNYNISVQMISDEYDKFIESGGNLDDYDNADTDMVDRNVKYTGNPRKWNTEIDKEVWYPYKITLDTLIAYNVLPLNSYNLIINDQNSEIAGKGYGYYSKDYGLYQIYQPGNTRYKYLYNKTDYIIGYDQLKMNSRTLVLVSGLKDLMALSELNLDIEIIAPKSETSLFSLKQIEEFRGMYENVITMFDNDQAGIQAMLNYKKLYKVPMLHINLGKDLADNNKAHSLDFLKVMYTLSIDKQIN